MPERKCERFTKRRSKKGREGKVEMKTFRSKRQMRPHSFFAFIPLATFAPRLLMLCPPPPNLPPFFTLYSFGFMRGWNNNVYNALGVEKVDVKTCTRKGVSDWCWDKNRKCSVHHDQQVGPSFWSSNVLFLLVTQPPACVFLTPFLIFLHFSTSAGFSLVLKMETFPLTPPPTRHPDTFLHPFIPMFHSFCLNRRQGNCISDFTCLAPN